MLFGSFSKSIGGGFRLGVSTRLSGRSRKRSRPTQRDKAVQWVTEKSESINRLLVQFPEDAEIDDIVAKQVSEAKDIAEHVLHAGGRMSDTKFRKLKHAQEALEEQLNAIPIDQRVVSKKYFLKDTFSLLWLLVQVAFYLFIMFVAIKACNAILGR